MTDDYSVHIIPFSAAERAGRGPDYDDEIKAIALYIYATAGNRSPALTAKQLARHFPPGTRLPDQKVLWQWAATENWRGRSDDIWRQYPGRVLSELQHLHVAAALISSQALLDIVSGEDKREVEERLVALKAYELVLKSLINLPQLARVTPQESHELDEEAPREEREANARKAIVRGKKMHTTKWGQGYQGSLVAEGN